MLYFIYKIIKEVSMNRLIDILKQCGAADAACIKYSDCDVINPKLTERLNFEPKSVIIAAVPYYTEYCDKPKSVSAYALAFDYHILLKEIAESAIKKAKNIFPEASFQFYGDHSPIHEKKAAAKAGLGILGLHSLLITEKYSSFVFLFEILTDMECSNTSEEVKYCQKCNKCIEACPTFLQGKGQCLSAITQKKGKLSDEEIKLIANTGCAWGCDICQMACPHTQLAIKKGTIYTKSDWFNSNLCLYPNESTVSDNSDFQNRAYSWRGKETILRNIKIINGEKE